MCMSVLKRTRNSEQSWKKPESVGGMFLKRKAGKGHGERGNEEWEQNLTWTLPLSVTSFPHPCFVPIFHFPVRSIPLARSLLHVLRFSNIHLQRLLEATGAVNVRHQFTLSFCFLSKFNSPFFPLKCSISPPPPKCQWNARPGSLYKVCYTSNLLKQTFPQKWIDYSFSDILKFSSLDLFNFFHFFILFCSVCKLFSPKAIQFATESSSNELNKYQLSNPGS